MVAKFCTRMDKCQRWARNPVIARVVAMAKLANRQRNHGGDQASKRHQQKHEGCGDHQAFAAMYVGGARFPNIEIQWNLACEFELYRRITAPQLIFKRACQLVNLRNKRLDWTVGRSEPYENKRSAFPAQKNRIAQLEIGHHS